MQTRTFVPARPILTLAALSAGIVAAGPGLLAQTAGTTGPITQGQEALTGSASLVMDRAEKLLSINQVWRAQQMLEPLTIRDGGVGMTDAERSRAFTLLSTANKRLKAL